MNGIVMSGRCQRSWRSGTGALRWPVLGVLIGVSLVASVGKAAEGAAAAPDAHGQKETIPCEVYPLKIQDPVPLGEVLAKLVHQTGKEGSEEQIVVVPERTTHSLIVRAVRTNQEWMAKLIRRLDEHPPEVLIECTMVEVTKDESFAYDLNMVRSTPDPAYAAPLMPTEPNASHFAPWVRQSLVGFYSDRQIAALLSRLCSKKYGRVLGKPKLLVNDRQKGTIETKETIYAKWLPRSTTLSKPV